MKFVPLVMMAFFGFMVILFLTMDSKSVRLFRPAPESPVAEMAAPIARVAPDRPAGAQSLENRSVSEMAKDLERTRVFADVLRTSSASKGDLLFEVRDAGPKWICGMPLIASSLTLGLVPGYFPYSRHYEFRVTHPESGVRLDCAASYSGEAIVGIWALPKRASREWVAAPKEGSAVLFEPHLRHDFYALAATMQDASDSSEAEQILTREAPDLNCRVVGDASGP